MWRRKKGEFKKEEVVVGKEKAESKRPHMAMMFHLVTIMEFLLIDKFDGMLINVSTLSIWSWELYNLELLQLKILGGGA
jgi:hypothetical protein